MWPLDLGAGRTGSPPVNLEQQGAVVQVGNAARSEESKEQGRGFDITVGSPWWAFKMQDEKQGLPACSCSQLAQKPQFLCTGDRRKFLPLHVFSLLLGVASSLAAGLP